MSRGLQVLALPDVLVIVAQFAVADWGRLTASWLLAAVAAGILVGFAEETLARGVILRSLRTNARPEAWVLVISSLWFGFMHLMNIVNGIGVVGAITQSLFATMSGVMFYLFRRARGLLVVAMLAARPVRHVQVLPAPTADLKFVDRLLPIVFVLSALVAVFLTVRRDRKITVTRTGVQDL